MERVRLITAWSVRGSPAFPLRGGCGIAEDQ
jgi:hypothetical protein